MTVTVKSTWLALLGWIALIITRAQESLVKSQKVDTQTIREKRLNLKNFLVEVDYYVTWFQGVDIVRVVYWLVWWGYTYSVVLSYNLIRTVIL